MRSQTAMGPGMGRSSAAVPSVTAEIRSKLGDVTFTGVHLITYDPPIVPPRYMVDIALVNQSGWAKPLEWVHADSAEELIEKAAALAGRHG